MASKDGLEVRKLLAKGTVIQKNADQPVAIRLKYIGTGTVTSVTVVTATGVTMITSDGGTDAYTFAAYTTMGALADAINADGIFEAKVLDVLLSAGSDNNLLAAALTTTTMDEAGNQVYDLVTDTSAFLQLGACLSPFRAFGSPKGHRVNLQEVKYFATLGSAAADMVQIWKRTGSTEVQLSGELSVSATATTINFADGDGYISSDENGEILVLLKDGASLADSAAFLRVTGIVE